MHTQERFLYLVQGNNRAIRYGIGVGREGFQWTGLKRIDRKAEWPDWTSPPEMIERQPYLPRFMAGGPGTRWAPCSLHQRYGVSHSRHEHAGNDRHGRLVGLFRLTNPELIGLYERVPVGTKVVVRQAAAL